MYRKSLCFIALTLFLGRPDLWAETSAPGVLSAKPVYVVDVQQVLEQSILGRAARSDLESEARKSEGKLERAKLDVREFEQSLTKQEGLLSGSALEQKREELGKRGRDYQRLLHDTREELERRNAAQIKKLVAEIREIVAALGAEKKIELVIERDPRSVLYVDTRYDLTKAVVAELDKKKLKL